MAEIDRFRGDTKPIVFKLWANKKAGEPLDIAGFGFKLTVNPVEDPVPADTPAFSLVGEIVGATTDGRVRFLPSAANMDLDPTLDYYFDFEVTDADGFVGTEIKDKFNVTQDITK